jgi:hypothetical protein
MTLIKNYEQNESSSLLESDLKGIKRAGEKRPAR